VELYRLYAPEELGGDGYPHEWHGYCGELEDDPLGGIKHRVREAADHRCVRCGHPYRQGEHGRGEWSPCDYRCAHGGPVRARNWSGDGAWRVLSVADVPRLVNDEADEVEARWRILTVHHLDGNKANCRWWNLMAACQRCHLEIQGKVRMERRWHHEHSAWFRPYVAGYYAHVYLGQEIGREEAEARLDELLALEVRQEALPL
jgi:hypothetical protein